MRVWIELNVREGALFFHRTRNVRARESYFGLPARLRRAGLAWMDFDDLGPRR